MKSYGAIVGACFLWGLIVVFYKNLTACGLDPMQIIWVRVLVTVLLLVVFLAARDRKQFRIRWKDWWVFFGCGVISFVLFNYCYFLSIDQMSVSVSAVLLNTAPIFIMLISIVFLKEKITRTKILALALAVFGCVLATDILVQPAGQVSTTGILLGLAAGLGYGLYSIFGKIAVRKGYSNLTIMLYSFLFALVGSAFFISPQTLFPVLTSAEAIINTVAIGILCTLLPYFLYNMGLERVDSGTASIVATTELVFASAVGIVLYHESITPGKCAGTLCIIGAVILLNLKFSARGSKRKQL